MKKITQLLYVVLFTLFSSVNLSYGQAQSQKPTLVFAASLYYMPFCALDSKGYMHGFSISLTRALCDIMKVNCIYKPMPFVDFFKSVQNKEVDAAIGAIAITPDRQAGFAFSIPYLPTQVSFVGKITKDKARPTEINAQALQGKIVGVQKGSFFYDEVIKKYPNTTIRYYENFHDLLAALMNGEVDFILTDTAVANYWIHREHNQFYIVGNYDSYKYGIGIMLNKDNKELQAKLNAAIKEFIQTPEFSELVRVFFFPFSS